jgi:hypothetical protein
VTHLVITPWLGGTSRTGLGKRQNRLTSGQAQWPESLEVWTCNSHKTSDSTPLLVICSTAAAQPHSLSTPPSGRPYFDSPPQPLLPFAAALPSSSNAGCWQAHLPATATVMPGPTHTQPVPLCFKGWRNIRNMTHTVSKCCGSPSAITLSLLTQRRPPIRYCQQVAGTMCTGLNPHSTCVNSSNHRWLEHAMFMHQMLQKAAACMRCQALPTLPPVVPCQQPNSQGPAGRHHGGSSSRAAAAAAAAAETCSRQSYPSGSSAANNGAAAVMHWPPNVVAATFTRHGQHVATHAPPSHAPPKPAR